MKRSYRLLFFLILPVMLSSCEFQCSVGKKEVAVPKDNEPRMQDGAAIYNGITLETDNIKLSKAYLVYEDGTRVPDNNFVEFKNSVKLLLLIDSGWQARDGKVFLTASEKVIAEDGTVILDKPNLFSKYEETGIDETDARIIGLSVIFTQVADQPTYNTVSFMVQDEVGKGYIKGSYRLYSK